MQPIFTQPMRNIVPNLVYAARGDEVAMVVDGQVLLENGRIHTVEEAEILAEAQRQAEPIRPRAAEEFWRAGGANSRFMQEGKL